VRLPSVRIGSRPATYTYAAVTGLAAFAAALALPPEGLAVSARQFWWIALASCLVVTTLVLRTGLWTASGAYAAVFWVFHFGLITVVGAGLVAPRELTLWDQLWVMGPYGADAALMALVGLLAFASGATLARAWRGSGAPAPHSGRAPAAAHPHGTAGAVLVLAALVIWAAIVGWTMGLPGFVSSYADYLDATAEYGGLLALVWLAMGCGLVMSVTGARGRLRTGALAAFAGFAVVALPLGLRGEILFPAVAAVVAATRTGWTLTPRRAGAFVVALLVVIPAMKEVRQAGLRGLPEMVVDLRFFDAFVELGGSLHPVEKVVRWRAEGEALEMGASYWAPIERAAARVLPGLRSAAAEDDMRIMNVLVMDRIGAIGFSPVAEAYRNFGALGVVCVLGLLGAAMASLDRIADRRLAVLAIATLYVPLLINVRNSFVSVPMQCLLGVFFVIALGILRHMSASIIYRPYARSPYVRSQV
jgi:hypothetical protein